MSVKEQALQMIESLPADTDYAEILKEIRLLASLREAERQSAEGKTVSHAEVKEQLAEWGGQ